MDSNETPEAKNAHRPRAFKTARRVVLTGVLAVVVSAGAVSLATAANSHHAANAARPAAAKAVTVAAKTKSQAKKSTATHKCPDMSGGSGGSSSYRSSGST